MAQQGTRPVKLGKVDPVWTRLRDEAEDAARREPALTGFIYSTVLNHDTLESAIVHRISERLAHADVSGELIRQAYMSALDEDSSIAIAFRADLAATVDRDPATHRYL